MSSSPLFPRKDPYDLGCPISATLMIGEVYRVAGLLHWLLLTTEKCCHKWRGCWDVVEYVSLSSLGLFRVRICFWKLTPWRHWAASHINVQRQRPNGCDIWSCDWEINSKVPNRRPWVTWINRMNIPKTQQKKAKKTAKNTFEKEDENCSTEATNSSVHNPLKVSDFPTLEPGDTVAPWGLAKHHDAVRRMSLVKPTRRLVKWRSKYKGTGVLEATTWLAPASF